MFLFFAYVVVFARYLSLCEGGFILSIGLQQTDMLIIQSDNIAVVSYPLVLLQTTLQPLSIPLAGTGFSQTTLCAASW